jgi:hypothetical protein
MKLLKIFWVRDKKLVRPFAFLETTIGESLKWLKAGKWSLLSGDLLIFTHYELDPVTMKKYRTDEIVGKCFYNGK